jgi:estrogen-related receptor beta like 1
MDEDAMAEGAPSEKEAGGEAERKPRARPAASEAPDNNPLIYMEDILDKLKLLDYENKFCRPKNLKPILKTYFAVPSANPNEQFYYFTSAVAWLMSLNNRNIAPPNQYDDPNAVAANILSELKNAGLPSEFAPSKLKQGHGDAVCLILLSLVDAALTATGFQMQKPVYPPDEYVEEAPVDDVDLTPNDEVVDTAAIDNDDDEEVLFSELHAHRDEAEDQGVKGGEKLRVDASIWSMELERMAPLLKVTMRPDNKEWRTHVETTADLQKVINTELPEATAQLDKLGGGVQTAMDSIATREKYINSHYEHLIADYRSMQEKLQETQNRANENSESVTNLTNDLARISDELEQIKSQMDDRGTSMTDTAPLVKMKQAMSKLKNEIKQMELRIGTVEHTLLHAKLRNKASIADTQMEMETGMDEYEYV